MGAFYSFPLKSEPILYVDSTKCTSFGQYTLVLSVKGPFTLDAVRCVAWRRRTVPPGSGVNTPDLFNAFDYCGTARRHTAPQ